MKQHWGIAAAGLAAAAFTLTISTAASATVFDTTLAPPGMYNGNGNPNAHFTVQNIGNIELGLGVQYRNTGPQVAPDAGTATYHVNTGVYTNPADFCSGTCALWNYEFSVNTNSPGGGAYSPLSNYTVTLSVLNVATGITQIVPVSFLDNAYYGPSGEHTTFDPNLDYGMQNSQNLAFNYLIFQNPNFTFDPTADGEYLITLALSAGNTALGSVQIDVIAGNGLTPSAAPLPGALPLFVSGLGALGFAARRRRRNSAKA